MVTGFSAAREQGYSHALQVDADGQHDPEDIPRFLAVAQARPDTLVCGAPVFGDDAPWVRVWGRKLTDLVVALETWSTGVRDSLCGFRVYPLEKTLAVIDGHRPGARMDFDADLLVALRWAIEAAAAQWPALGAVRSVSNLKFQRPILPPATLTLILELRTTERAEDEYGHRLAFRYEQNDRPCVRGGVHFA
jgi:hypothetical protein